MTIIWSGIKGKFIWPSPTFPALENILSFIVYFF